MGVDFDYVIRCGSYPQVPDRFKKKNQVKGPSIWSRVPKTGSDPSIVSDRNRGVTIQTFPKKITRKKNTINASYHKKKMMSFKTKQTLVNLYQNLNKENHREYHPSHHQYNFFSIF